jgi:hypothetical protein
MMVMLTQNRSILTARLLLYGHPKIRSNAARRASPIDIWRAREFDTVEAATKRPGRQR